MVEKTVLETNEFLLLLISISVLIFIAVNSARFRQIRHSKILIRSFIIFLVGWFFTVLEGFLWPTFLNLMEHICYLAGTVFLTIWCWKISAPKSLSTNSIGKDKRKDYEEIT